MVPVVRVLVAAALVLIGMTATIFLGGERGACLGPLGVTEVECAQTTGIVPSFGIGLPILAVALAGSVFVLAPVSADARVPVIAAGIVGGAIGGLAFLALRPQTMDGLTSSDSWISIARPLDENALATAIVVGAFAGSYLWRLRRSSAVGQ